MELACAFGVEAGAMVLSRCRWGSAMFEICGRQSLVLCIAIDMDLFQ